jgi:hypothetical protein
MISLNKEENPYLKIVSDLVSKLSFYISTILSLSPSPLLDSLMINAGSLLRYLSHFQYCEPLVFYQCLDTYIQMCLSIVLKNNSFNPKCQKTAIIALYKIINTFIYHPKADDPKEKETTPSLGIAKERREFMFSEPQNVGIVKAPGKYKNFQEELKEAIVLYKLAFSENVVVDLLEICTGKYLKLECLDMWEIDTENFIETEDELLNLRSQELTTELSFNKLAYDLIYKASLNIPEIFHPWFRRELEFLVENKEPSEGLMLYARESIQGYDVDYRGVPLEVLVEEAILRLISFFPHNYFFHNISDENMLNHDLVLQYLESRISETDSKILKRRY